MESNTEVNHRIAVAEDINKLFLSQVLSDVMFVVEGKQICAHKLVLAARSDTFRDIFFEQTSLIGCKREIHINDCSALSFKNFIKYIYSGKISLAGIDETESQELLALALKYQMKELVECLLEPNIDLTFQSEPEMKVTSVSKTNPVKFEDIANAGNGAVVIEAINPDQLFSRKKDLEENSLTKHKIEVNTKGIVVKLNAPVVINLIKFRLYDIEPKRYYSYYVQTSADCVDWKIAADYRQYSCRSWQTIIFEERPVQYIQILGTHSNEKSLFSNTRYLTLISLFCGLTKNQPKITNGIWEPEYNVATISRGAVVVINNGKEWSSKLYVRNAKMINNSIELEFKKRQKIYSDFKFDGESQLIIHLSQPIITSSLSFYIYGEDMFKYTVNVSCDSIDKQYKNWILVADKRNQFNSSKWQNITFNKTKVLLISISNICCLNERVTLFPVLAFNCPG